MINRLFLFQRLDQLPQTVTLPWTAEDFELTQVQLPLAQLQLALEQSPQPVNFLLHEHWPWAQLQAVLVQSVQPIIVLTI